MTNPTPHEDLVGGIDSHTDTIHVALIDGLGRDVDDHEFATTASGYRAAVAWLAGHGQVACVGVEGTSSYGRGVTTALAGAGIQVVGVNRTRPAERRRAGKSDRLDAYRAARSVLSGEATTPPKDGSVEPLRALMVARRSALKACSTGSVIWGVDQATVLRNPIGPRTCSCRATSSGCPVIFSSARASST